MLRSLGQRVAVPFEDESRIRVAEKLRDGVKIKLLEEQRKRDRGERVGDWLAPERR